jgi:hypothetical protein
MYADCLPTKVIDLLVVVTFGTAPCVSLPRSSPAQSVTVVCWTFEEDENVERNG